MKLPPFLEYKDNELHFDDHPLTSVVNEFGTPCYTYSAAAIQSRLSELQNGLKVADPLICFAVKANSNIALLKFLTEAGTGLDLVSGGELHRADLAKTPGEKIVFSGVGKSRAEIASALNFQAKGIACFNVESISELHAINSIATELNRVAPVALRLNPDVDAKTHPYISTGLKKNKFGLSRSEILELLKNSHLFPKIDFLGVSIHIGSQMLTLAPLEASFKKVREIVEEMNPLLPKGVRWVDLGGGIGISYRGERAPSLTQYCKLIVKYFGPQSGYRGKLVIEPGRALIGNAGILLTQVLYIKKRGKKTFVILDAAMTDLMRPALYGSHHEIIPVRQIRGPSTLCNVVGGVCETSDSFGENRSLPSQLREGDLLAILSAGAYGFSMANAYNSRPRPPEVFIENGAPRLIRRRETVADLVVGENY